MSHLISSETIMVINCFIKPVKTFEDMNAQVWWKDLPESGKSLNYPKYLWSGFQFIPETTGNKMRTKRVSDKTIACMGCKSRAKENKNEDDWPLRSYSATAADETWHYGNATQPCFLKSKLSSPQYSTRPLFTHKSIKSWEKSTKIWLYNLSLRLF